MHERIQWCGRSVEVYEGLADHEKLQSMLGGEFPWLCANDVTRRLEVVCPEWYEDEQGDLDFACLGVSFDDLLERFIETFAGEQDDCGRSDAAIAIATLGSALEKLKLLHTI